MAKKLQELLTEIATKSNQVAGLFDEADKRGGDATKDEIETIKSLNKEIEGLEIQASELKEFQEMRRGNEARVKTFTEPANNIPHHSGNGEGSERSQTFKSISDEVMNDPAMKTFLKSFNGASRQQFNSPVVEVKTLITGLSSTSAGAMVVNERKPIIDAAFMRPLTIMDIITIGETTSDTVEYVRVGTPTNSAAPVAEATASSDGTGAKPESALPLSVVSETVKTIAHWIPATNRAIADAGQLRTLIDQFLRYGLEEELEDQIITGSGTGENFTGVLNVTGQTAQAWDTNILTTTRKGRTKVRTVGRATPTAYVLNPTDWETIDLLQDNEARYYFGGPSQIGQPRLWGLPVVESEAMTQGIGVVADWKTVVLWNRMQTMISMSNSHSDFFVRNLVAILAELRAAMGVIRPAATVEMDLVA
jgi:HK97 family phage major capsid protein